MKILRTNLILALEGEIKRQKELAHSQGMRGESGYCAGLREVADALKRGESLEVVGDYCP